MLILVKTETGTTIGISAEPNDKIEKVKLIISNKHKISFHEQKLTYNGKLLQNNKTLRDYHIKNNCTLHLMTKTRGMINAVEKSNHISLMNKSKTKSIKLESYYISDKSDIFDGSNMIGIVLYQHNGQTEWESLNGIQCKSGFVYLCKTDSLTNIYSSPFNTNHAKCYKKLFGEDPDYTKIVGAAFGYVDKKWKYNSGTFNAPNIRSSMIAEEYKMGEFIDEWHNNKRNMHKYEEQWLKQTIEQWISSDFSETICYVSYVTWSWWKGEWINYDPQTNNWIENQYEEYSNNAHEHKEYSIDLNTAHFVNNKKLTDKYRIHFSSPNIYRYLKSTQW
eukprot:203873_1